MSAWRPCAIGPQCSGYVFPWLSPDTYTTYVKRALRAGGYGHLTLHKLRRTFAALLKDEGIDAAAVGELLMHTDRRATEVYAHVDRGRLHRAISAIPTGPLDTGGKKG